jgi:hypothetical protein
MSVRKGKKADTLIESGSREDRLVAEVSRNYRDFRKAKIWAIHDNDSFANVIVREVKMGSHRKDMILGDLGQATQDEVQSHICPPFPDKCSKAEGNFIAKLTAVILDKSFEKQRIKQPPGSFLTEIADFLFCKKTFERVVAPVISDMQLEYCEALASGRSLKAKWICVRGYWCFFKALGLYTTVKKLFEVWQKFGPA